MDEAGVLCVSDAGEVAATRDQLHRNEIKLARISDELSQFLEIEQRVRVLLANQPLSDYQSGRVLPGNNDRVQALHPKPASTVDRIVLAVGLDIYVEFTLDEARHMIRKRVAELRAQRLVYSKDIDRVYRLVENGLMDVRVLNKPARFVDPYPSDCESEFSAGFSSTRTISERSEATTTSSETSDSGHHSESDTLSYEYD